MQGTSDPGASTSGLCNGETLKARGFQEGPSSRPEKLGLGRGRMQTAGPFRKCCPLV